jgi:hypothetical protein
MTLDRLFQLLAAGLSAFALAGVATAGERDPLCAEIKAFANAAEPGTSHSVSLVTVWGPSAQRPDSLMYKNCEHGGYEPGAALCRYLMANTSTEFPEHNFRRALACLNGQRKAPPKHVAVERMDALLWAHEAPGVREGTAVGVEVRFGDQADPTLKIIAEAGQP